MTMQPLCEYCGSPMIAVKPVSTKKEQYVIARCIGCGNEKKIGAGSAPSVRKRRKGERQGEVDIRGRED